MRLVAPDILLELRGLSPFLCGVGLTIGLLVWLLGWRAHRFWIVLATTVIAGMLGLFSSRSPGMQPLVVGLLLAVTSGLLALHLARVLAFVAGGFAGMMLLQAVAPGWEEPLLSFFAGGLTGVVLFRLWMMALTSLAGSLLMAHFGLCLAECLRKVDAAAVAERSSLLLNWCCGGAALLGLVMQYLVERWHGRMGGKDKKAGDKDRKPKAPPAEKPAPPPEPSRSMWDWIPLRRAG